MVLGGHLGSLGGTWGSLGVDRVSIGGHHGSPGVNCWLLGGHLGSLCCHLELPGFIRWSWGVIFGWEEEILIVYWFFNGFSIPGNHLYRSLQGGSGVILGGRFGVTWGSLGSVG